MVFHFIVNCIRIDDPSFIYTIFILFRQTPFSRYELIKKQYSDTFFKNL